MTDIPYAFPKHRISFQKGKYKIIVFLRGLLKVSPKQRMKLLMQLAEKKPLIAMAYIHKCAEKGDLDAQAAAHQYALYQRSLEKDTVIVKVPHIRGKYPAFPDLIKHKDTYYLAYREANRHQGDKGKIRILKGHYQKNRWKWEKAGLLESPTYDLRDPKFFRKQDTLGLMIGGSIIKTKKMVPHVGFIHEGAWVLKQAVVPKTDRLGQWIWQVTWHKKAGYGFAYGPDKYKTLHLMKTEDGYSFKKIATLSYEGLQLTEATIRFKKNGTAIALLRADPKTCIATASPPYKRWKITPLAIYGGGQNFVLTKGSFGFVTTRHLFLSPDNTIEERQLLARLNKEKLTPMQTFPSQIDTGYAGMVVEKEGALTIAYYSAARDGTSSIYLARLPPDEVL